MFLNGSDISNVKGYAFSRAATLTEVSILNRIELKLNHHSILQSKKSSWRKIMTFFQIVVCLFMKNSQVENVSHFSVKSHINLWHNNGWKKQRNLFFLRQNIIITLLKRKYKKENIFTVYFIITTCFQPKIWILRWPFKIFLM